MKDGMRWMLVGSGLITLAVAAGFYVQAGWAVRFWPVENTPMGNIFLSSILAAIGVPLIWIGLAAETRAMAGGAINLLVSSVGFVVSALVLFPTRNQPVLLFLITSGMFVIGLLVLFQYSRRFPFRDTRVTPAPVRGSFVVFALALLLAGGALVLRLPNIFPWNVSPENSVLYGWIFLGNMCYFLYGLRFPVWANARGQLLAFLAYDLVLILPMLRRFGAVPPEMLPSLIIYVAVLIYSGVLALYFLFLHPQTRFGSRGKHTQQPAVI